MAQRRPAIADEPEETSQAPASIHLKRADGLDVEISGPPNFVAQALERVLVALGIVAPPS